MACGCNKTRVYEVTTKAGQRKEVTSLSAAMQVIREEGGSYQVVKK
jgi:hypothetical protein